jgi:hypothetical protein
MPLSGATLTNVSQAKNAAVLKTRGEHVTDEGTNKGTWLPTACTDLFLNSPLGRTGASLLGNYIVYRDGTGVKDAAGVDVCGSNTVAAWTKCCEHDPVVFICPSRFNSSSASDRVKYLIHEALHVGGQSEDKNGSVGPDDPPNSTNINDIVDAACN